MKSKKCIHWLPFLSALCFLAFSVGCEDLSGLVDGDAGTEDDPSDGAGDQIDTNDKNTPEKPDKIPEDTEIQEKLFEKDPREHGPHGTKTVSRKIAGQNATFYLPTVDHASDALAEGPFPLVVVMPGYQAKHTQYSHFTRHLVSHGFVGVGIEFPGDNHEKCAEHTIRVIDWLLSEDNPHRCRINKNEIIAAGHSMGGKIAIYASALDGRITNVLAWDPVDTGGPPCDIDPVACKRWSVTPELMPDIEAKLLIFGGMVGASLSCTPKGETHHDFFAEVKGTGLHVDLPGSDHLDWPDDAGEGAFGAVGSLICGGKGKLLGKTVHRIAETIQGAWLLKYVKGYTNLDGYLTGEEWSKEINGGVLKLDYLP